MSVKMNWKIHHIGIATEDISEMSSQLLAIGAKQISEIIYDEKQKAYLCMFMLDGGRIELVSGEQVSSRVKRKQYLYHTCYEVENIENVCDFLKKTDSVKVVEELKPAILFNNRRVAFFMTKLGLIELLEKDYDGIEKNE